MNGKKKRGAFETALVCPYNLRLVTPETNLSGTDRKAGARRGSPRRVVALSFRFCRFGFCWPPKVTDSDERE